MDRLIGRAPGLVCGWISREEADRLIAEVSRKRQAEQLPDFVLLALDTGCRIGGAEGDRTPDLRIANARPICQVS